MVERKYLSCVILFIVLLLQSIGSSLAAPESVPASTQPVPLVHLRLAQSSSFPEALAALAAQGHVAIVAEGAPLVPRLSKKDTPDLTVPLPLSEAVTKVAASFDYDAQKQDDVFILTKRYTDPKEMPCVTLEECDQAFKDILTLLDQFNPNFDEASADHSQRNTVITFFNSLTPGQLQEARNKTLHYGELGPEQQKAVESLFLYGFVQFPTYKFRETVNILDYAPGSVITGQDKGRDALFIEVPMPANKLIHYYKPLAGGISPPDQSSPLILPKQTEPGRQSLSAPMTLETLVGLLPHTGPPAVVDTPLKGKPVSVAGLSNASAIDVLRALEVLYNLRIGASNAGGEELMRRTPLTPDSLRDLSLNVWSLLPISMVRAVHLEDAPASQTTPADENKAESPKNDFQRSKAEADRRFQQQMQSHRLLPTLWSEAVQQVTIGVQPQFRSRGLGTRIPVRTLSGTTRRALAVALSVSALELLQSAFTGQINQNIMDCLDDINNVLVYTVPAQAAIIHGQTVPSIYFEGTNPYTKEKIGLGGVMFGTMK